MKNIIKSLLMIVAAVAIVGGATYSAYHKEGSVLGATFSNDDQMDLKIDQSISGDIYDWVNNFTVPAEYEIKNVRPGSSGEQILDIKNVGNVDARATIKLHVHADTPLYHSMNFTILFDADHDGTFETPIASANAPLTAWNNQTFELGQITSLVTTDGLPTGSRADQFTGKIASVKIMWSVPTEIGNEIMGSEVVIDTVFGLDSI